MSTSPWGNAHVNKKVISYTTEMITAAFVMQKLRQAKNLEDVVKIQTEFVKTQTDSFNAAHDAGRRWNSRGGLGVRLTRLYWSKNNDQLICVEKP